METLSKEHIAFIDTYLNKGHDNLIGFFLKFSKTNLYKFSFL